MNNIYKETIDLLKLLNLDNNFYLNAHPLRYQRTIEHLAHFYKSKFDKNLPTRALEIGTSSVINVFMKELLHVDIVDVTTFTTDRPLQSTISIKLEDRSINFDNFHMNLEKDLFPVEDNTYDLIVMCEVLEHFDCDPMFVMCEINRILKPGGYIFFTTPNSTSSQNLERILLGYSPHFFMKYEKNGSPYKHNFEYSTHDIKNLLESSGMNIINCWTEDLFGVPESKTAISILSDFNFPLTDRGDDILVFAEKISQVTCRYPNHIYI